MKMILLPQWVEKAIQSHGEQLGTVLTDLDKLSTILSPDDVAFYVYINAHPDEFLSQVVANSFEEQFFKPTMCADVEPGSWEACYEQHVFSEAPDPQTVWFGESLGVASAEGVYHQKPRLKADMLSYDTVVIRPEQCRIGDADENSMQTFYSRLLSLLYTRCSFEALAGSPLFKEWLRSVSS